MSRLIDADALKDGYMNMGYDPNEHPEESYMEGWCKGFNAAVDHCIGHVIYATTIEERKTGRWTHAWGTDDAIWKCSECGFEIDAHGCDSVEYLETYKFCPNCGSDNREEGDRRC